MQMVGGTSWIGSSYEVVYMSAVILLHQVYDTCGYYLYMFLHCMNYAQI